MNKNQINQKSIIIHYKSKSNGNSNEFFKNNLTIQNSKKKILSIKIIKVILLIIIINII